MTKVEVNRAEVARLRREGKTWSEVREATGTKLGSGPFTKRLNEAGFDAAGLRLDGKGPRESKARVKNGNGGGGSKPKASKSSNANAATKRGSRCSSGKVTAKVDPDKVAADAKAAEAKRSRRAGKQEAKA